MFLKTKIDEMIELIGKKKKMNLGEISKKLKWEPGSVEKIAIVLDKKGLLKTHYPLTMIGKPWIELTGEEKVEEEKIPQEKAIEKYQVKSRDQIIADVKIYESKDDKRPRYFVSLPQISRYTRAYFEYVKDEISRDLPFTAEEKTRAELSKAVEERRAAILKKITKDLKPDEKTAGLLTQVLLNDMYGLGNLEVLVSDIMLEEIAVNTSKVPVAVYHRKHGWMKTNIVLKNEEDIQNYASQIARKVGRQVNILSPLLDAHLITGDRVNATYYPISTSGNTITLRLFARTPWTVVSFLKKENNSFSAEMAALLWQAVHYEMNVLVAGGTASGKTSALNAIAALIPPYQRIVTIEDTREMMLPVYQWNWVPLVTREANPEGLGEVTMLDLVVNSLRMRPDRIVMGEIRRKEEAEVLFEAMHTGHSVYATIHADTGSQTMKRLTEPPIEVPESEVVDIDLLLVQYRNRRLNVRRTLELSEVSEGPSGLELKRLYVYKPRKDTFEALNPPRRYIERLNLHTGMTEKEIKEDQKGKADVLKWLVDKDFSTIDQVGGIMKAYYANEDEVVKAANKKIDPKKFI